MNWWRSPTVKTTPIRLMLSPLLISVHGIGRCATHYQRRKVSTDLETNPFIYNDDLHARRTSTTVAQSLWEKRASIWLDYISSPWDDPHLQDCLGGQVPETSRPETQRKSKYHCSAETLCTQTTLKAPCPAVDGLHKTNSVASLEDLSS